MNSLNLSAHIKTSITTVLNVLSHPVRAAQRGFTLIELMIVVAIIAILSAIAFPSFADYLVQSRRAEAKSIMMRGALWMERNQSTAYSYAVDAAGVALVADTLKNVGLGRSPENAVAGKENYLITLNWPVPAEAARSFEIRAAPQNNQLVKDTKCGTLVINQLGQKGIMVGTTANYNSADALYCWAQ